MTVRLIYFELMDPAPYPSIERQHWSLVVEIEDEAFDAYAIAVWA